MLRSVRTRRVRQWWLVGAVAVAAVVAIVAGMLASGDDDQEVAGVDTSTTVEEAPGAEPGPAVFPFAADDVRFDDPQEAVRYWAEGIVGFVDPVYGEYRAGDARSGEIVVRPTADGPETVVLVRQLDETWWILGAVAEDVALTSPAADDRLVSPVALAGTGRAPEGRIEVELWTDGADEPLAMASVPVGVEAAEAFEGSLGFDQQPETADGALYLRIRGVDGEVLAATVVRVRF
jgi:hypothetical protein